MIKFKDIQNIEQLLTRCKVLDDNSYSLSCGNQIKQVMRVINSCKQGNWQDYDYKINVTYCSKKYGIIGKNSTTCYIKK